MSPKQSSTEQLVMSALAARSEATVAELASATGLGRSTVGTALVKLEQSRKGPPRRGRPPGRHAATGSLASGGKARVCAKEPEAGHPAAGAEGGTAATRPVGRACDRAHEQARWRVPRADGRSEGTRAIVWRCSRTSQNSGPGRRRAAWQPQCRRPIEFAHPTRQFHRIVGHADLARFALAVERQLHRHTATPPLRRR
jgi:hypothetical protein